MKKLIVNDKQEYIAKKIIKKGNNIILINVVDEEGNNIGNLTFPNISNMDDFQLEEGQEWDIPEEDEQALHQLNLDFRISMLELGGNANDL